LISCKSVGDDVFFSREVTLYGYSITAGARPYTGENWIGDFEISKDGQRLHRSDMAICRNSEASAISGALLMGVQYVDVILMPAAEMDALRVSGLPTKG
jgi:hypothetical protein